MEFWTIVILSQSCQEQNFMLLALCFLVLYYMILCFYEMKIIFAIELYIIRFITIFNLSLFIYFRMIYVWQFHFNFSLRALDVIYAEITRPLLMQSMKSFRVEITMTRRHVCASLKLPVYLDLNTFHMSRDLFFHLSDPTNLIWSIKPGIFNNLLKIFQPILR